jgi:hypothetical protein
MMEMPVDIPIVSQILKSRLMTPESIAEGRRAYALVDGALLQASLPALSAQWPVRRGISLLTGADTDALEVGPLLYELSIEELDGAVAEQFFNDETGQSVASFIISPLSLKALAAHLAPLVEVQLADQKTIIMRFFDPRVLEFWLADLPANYQAYLAQGVRAWIQWDSNLQVQVHAFEPPAEPPVVAFPIKLSERQEDDFLTACYPHTLVERFRTTRPDLLAQVPPPQRYAFFKEQIARCQTHGIEGAPAMEMYCALAIEVLKESF